MNNRKYKKKDNIIDIIPIILFVAVIPLIVRMTKVNVSMVGYNWYPDTTSIYDFFAYYKSIGIIIIGFLCGVILLAKISLDKNFKLKKNYLYIPIGVYCLFVVISWLFSINLHIATWGYIERYEGSLVLLSYMIVMVYAMNMVNNERQLKWILYGLCIFIGILSILGLSQFLGHDFFQTTIGKKLIMPKEYWDNLDTVSFSFTKRQIYLTFYNINYVGFIFSFLIPIFGSLLLEEKKNWKKALWIIIILACLFLLLGSRSRGGLVGAVGGIILLIIVKRKKILEKWKAVLTAVIICILIILGLSKMTDGVILQRITSIFDQNTQEEYNLKDIKIDGDTIHVQYTGYDLTIKMASNDKDLPLFYDKNMKKIEVKENKKKGRYTLKDELYKEVYKRIEFSKVNDELIMELLISNKKWKFAMTNEGFVYVNPYGKKDIIENADSVGFQGQERLASGRGYIWSRSIPLLKSTMFKGGGADTYALQFPQNDYVMKENVLHRQNIVVDKPHNMYLQGAINTGVISLAALIAFYLIYIIWSFKLYWNIDSSNLFITVGQGIFLGTCAYLIAGISNDSNVSTSPIFWGLLGIGVACNAYVKKEKAE